MLHAMDTLSATASRCGGFPDTKARDAELGGLFVVNVKKFEQKFGRIRRLNAYVTSS